MSGGICAVVGLLLLAALVGGSALREPPRPREPEGGDAGVGAAGGRRAVEKLVYRAVTRAGEGARRRWQPPRSAEVGGVGGDIKAAKQLPKNNTYSFEYAKGFRIPGDEPLISDRRFFVFPPQDVEMLLIYPKVTSAERRYIITEFRIAINQDSPRSEGYLLNGGVRHQHLSLQLVASSASAFSYELTVYGILHDLLSPEYDPDYDDENYGDGLPPIIL